MPLMLSILRGALVLAVVGLVACEGEAAPVNDRPTPLPTATVTPLPADPGITPQATQLKVVYRNILSPLTVDENNPVAAETFNARLEQLVSELRALDADVIALSEVAWTREGGSATEYLARELRMEFLYVRANPWFPGQGRAESDATASQVGFEEGELLLSRYPILRAKRHALNPRTSETEVRAVLHAVIRGPAGLGEVDIYITRLGIAPANVLESQASDLARFISWSRGPGAVLVLADLASTPGSPAVQAVLDAGFLDVVTVFEGEGQAFLTCCRTAVLGEPDSPETRTDYVLARRLIPLEAETFGNAPSLLAGRPPLYASDHDGLVVVFALELPD